MAVLTPINPAEAIIDPFWDPLLSGLQKWTVTPGAGHGLALTQGWCFATFAWTRRPASGPALEMERSFDLAIGDYDRLLLSILAPSGSLVSVEARTELGVRRTTFPPAGERKRELALELEGARRLLGLRIAIEAGRDGAGAGWLNWVGLQSTRELERYLRQWRRFDARWEDFLRAPGGDLSFKPALGLLVNEAELERLRSSETGTRLVDAARAAAKAGEPESLVNDVLLFIAQDTRYSREREHGRSVLGKGSSLAIAGAIARDAELLRMAARYAMAILMTGSWEWGMVSTFPGSSFEIRSFSQSSVIEELVLIWDLAGELFTPAAHELLKRRVAQDGMGNSNLVAWRHEYIHHCNQLAAFSPGRVTGYALLERSWPRVKPYLELAFRDLSDSMEGIVLPDGGFVEGPSYFHYTVSTAARAIRAYARHRGMSVPECTPASLARSASFADAVLSTDESQDHIPICDAHSRAHLDSLAFLASSVPASSWVTMYRKAEARNGSEPPSVFAWAAGAEAPERGPTPPAFTRLGEMRLAASLRSWNGRAVKLLVLGNRSGAGHAHEDKGSFVLECGGATFAMDPGICDYSHPLSLLLKNCERHNMLVPWGTTERPHPDNPLHADVDVEAAGDERSFRSSLSLERGWERFFKRWRREIVSETPDRLRVTDDFELAPGSGAKGVEQYWNTSLPVSVDPGTVRIRGAGLVLEIAIPSGCTCRVDELELLAEEPGVPAPVQRRIAFRRDGASGTITVEARFVPEGASRPRARASSAR